MNAKRLGGPVLAGPRLITAIWRRIAWRSTTLLHRLTVGSIGAGARVYPGVHFIEPAAVHIGSECWIFPKAGGTADGDAARLILGEGVRVNRGVHLDHSGDLVIGNNTLISEESVIYTHDHGLNPRSEPQAHSKIIGSNVWVGMRSIVMASCHAIGDEAVIGAGSVVTRDVPAGAIVAGVPARVIGWKDGYCPRDWKQTTR